MTFAFRPAARSRRRLRLAAAGTSGSGKTLSMLRVLRGLVGPQGRIAVLDTENESASIYANDIAGGYDVAVLDPADIRPRTFVEAIHATEEAGYDALLIDSLSHAWQATLALVDRKTAASRSKNSFTDGWREASPEHDAMIAAILGSSLHIAATLRTKTEWVLEEDERGKKAPRKVGMAPVQRAGVEYEFDVVLDLDSSHRAVVSKSRAKYLDGAVIPLLSERDGERLARWLHEGAPEAPRAATPAPAAAPAPEVAPAPKPSPAPASEPQEPGPAEETGHEALLREERPAVELGRQLAEARGLEALRAVAAVVDAAVRAGAVSAEERAALGEAYRAARTKLNGAAPPAAAGGGA